MKKIILSFVSAIVFMAISQVSLAWNQGMVLDESLEETGTLYISQSSHTNETWKAVRVLKYNSGEEVIDIFTPYFLAPDNGKAEVRFTIDSGRVIKLDMYTWGGGIHNTARVYIDPESSKYKKLISQMKSGNSMEIVVKNTLNETASFEIPLAGFTKAYNQLNGLK